MLAGLLQHFNVALLLNMDVHSIYGTHNPPSCLSSCRYPIGLTESHPSPVGSCRKKHSGLSISSADKLTSVKSMQSQKASNHVSPTIGNPAIEDKCQLLVNCIAQIGGTQELQDSLHKHMLDQASKTSPSIEGRAYSLKLHDLQYHPCHYYVEELSSCTASSRSECFRQIMHLQLVYFAMQQNGNGEHFATSGHC